MPQTFGRTVVLVEGASDRLALEALAARRGQHLEAQAVSIVAIGGATNARKYMEALGPHGTGVRLAGLCDAAEEDIYKRALKGAGIGSSLTRADMERLGFFVCVDDLEDELIRSLGGAAVERVIDAQGELELFRTLQQQPQWRDRPPEDQMRRFFGTYRGRKIRSAAPLVEALDLKRVPRPLHAVLDFV